MPGTVTFQLDPDAEANADSNAALQRIVADLEASGGDYEFLGGGRFKAHTDVLDMLGDHEVVELGTVLDDEPDTDERPKGNASREDWAAYAVAQGFEVAEDATRDEIRDAVLADDDT